MHFPKSACFLLQVALIPITSQESKWSITHMVSSKPSSLTISSPPPHQKGTKMSSTHLPTIKAPRYQAPTSPLKNNRDIKHPPPHQNGTEISGTHLPTKKAPRYQATTSPLNRHRDIKHPPPHLKGTEISSIHLPPKRHRDIKHPPPTKKALRY